MGKLYPMLMMIIGSSTIVFIVFYNDIISIYANYFVESEWGVVVAIMMEILYFERNLVFNLVIMVVVGLIGGLISRNKVDGVYSGVFAGITISITWLVLVIRFMPGYWASSVGVYEIIEVVIRGIMMGIVLGGAGLIGGLIISYKSKNREEDRPVKIEVSCPYCKREFKSNPVYCCYCNKKIADD
ncbi:MAG: hypothetical protein ACTSRP_24715 [Candidatus Helarchaeota archaeon]